MCDGPNVWVDEKILVEMVAEAAQVIGSQIRGTSRLMYSKNQRLQNLKDVNQPFMS